MPEQTTESVQSNTIEQVRDLLFGEAQRGNDKRHDELNAAIEALRQDMPKRLNMLEARLIEQDRNAEQRHIAAIRGIGTAISELGEQVSKFADPPRSR
jgi:alpha-D-ribose 1-methylphosphonate 5-triphosphate synthase subunit PhnG